MSKKFFSAAVPAFIIACVLVFFGVGCQRDFERGPGGSNPTPADDNITVQAGIRGTVIDENNQPVTGATVTSGTNTTTTDTHGNFRFNTISLSKNNGAVKVVKAGYFTGIRTFVSTAGRIHNVRIRLLPKTNTGSFTGSTGGTVTLSTGGKLVMPANAVTDAAGAAYTGTVNVAMTWIDPSASNLPEIMMGDLRGITTTGEEKGLSTYGMLGVEMTTPGGQPLKVATGKTAELTFPIPSAIAGTAPATIDLWHFDETKNRWIQEGTATKTGTNYVANVSHFSFWNCDFPFGVVDLCMTVVNAANSQPLGNTLIRLKRPDGSYGYGWTDSAGNVCGKVPKDEALVLQVMDQCYAVAYSQNIGPFSAATSLGTISVTLPAVNTLIITGTVTNCAGANVTNGGVIVYVSGSYSYTAPITNGNFSVNILRCSGGTLNFSVIGVDYGALQQSVPVGGSGTTGTVNVGTIQACGTSSAQYAQYIINGNVYNFASPPDQFGCGDSTGTFGVYSHTTAFSGNNPMGSFNLYFYNNNTPGVYPINYGIMQYTASVQALSFVNPNPMVTITSFGPGPGGFIEGNFNEVMVVSGTPKTVSCNFRIRRN